MKSFAAEAAYEFILGKILVGDYPSGKVLVSDQLAGEIGTSRTPVREALRQLEIDGLVEITHGVGTNVRGADLHEFVELCDTRLALESHAACLAARRRSTYDLNIIGHALDQMRSLVKRMVEGNGEQNLCASLEIKDAQFHIAVISAAHNKLIKKEILRLHLIGKVIGGLRGSLRMQRAKDDSDRRLVLSLACHEAIYEAIRSNDADAAKEAMENHLQDVVASLIESVKLARQSPVGSFGRAP